MSNLVRIRDYLKVVGQTEGGKDILKTGKGKKFEVVCHRDIPFRGMNEGEDMHRRICQSAPKGAAYYKLVKNLPCVVSVGADSDYIETVLGVWFFKDYKRCK